MKSSLNKTWLLLAAIPLVISCQNNPKEADIVTSLFPQYDIARHIAADKLTVSLLPPLGAEVHDYSPSPADVSAVNKASLFLYTSDKLEPWIKNSSENVNSVNLSSVDTSSLDIDYNLPLSHYWTDPLVFISMIDMVSSAITNIDQDNGDYYQNNAETYKEEIHALHEDLSSFLSSYSEPKIFFAGHNALEPFAKRYGLDISSFSDSFQPDAEITPRQLENLKNRIVADNIHYLFIEELIVPAAAIAIRNELARQDYDLTLSVLHGYHNISKDDYEKGVTYADIFAENIDNIKTALSH